MTHPTCQLGNNFAHPAARGFREIHSGKLAAVTVENLERVSARAGLHVEVSRDGGGEFFSECEVRFPVFAEEGQARVYSPRCRLPS